MSLFTRFGLGHLLCRMSLEKQAGIPAVQLILSFCLFRIAGESIHSMYKKSYYELLNTGHNCYYRMMGRATMDWRKLLMGEALRFLVIDNSRIASFRQQNDFRTAYLYYFAINKIVECFIRIVNLFDSKERISPQKKSSYSLPL